MKLKSVYHIFLSSSILLAACNAVDRSGEQPFAPTVKTLGVASGNDETIFNGEVVASPNSDVLECGFLYGNDTLRVTLKCDEVNALFTASTDSIEAGDYFAVAYARNGVGTSYGDTVRFSVSNQTSMK